MKRWQCLVVSLGFFFIAGCGQSGDLNLSETHVFAGFGFSIDYPQDWFAITEGAVTWIAELELDFNTRHRETPKTEGIKIILDHRPLAFLESLGLPSDSPTINDLFQLNIDELTGMTDPQITETVLFGVPALRSEYYENQWDISYAGFIGDEAFFFIVTAPTKDMLSDFKPTWELMLASITPVDE